MNCKLFNIFFVFLCVLSSCNGTLDLSAHVHIPYCGGAKPTHEMERGRLDPMDTVFVTKSLRKKQKTIQVPLDINGCAQIKLRKGNYSLFHKHKLLSVKEFNKLYRPENNKWYTYKGDSCLYKYMSNPDAVFGVSKQKKIKVIVKSRCYTGINPCIDYSGPLRP